MAKIAVPNLSRLLRQPDKFGSNFSPNLAIFCDFDGPIIDVSERYYCTYRLGLDRVEAVCQAEGVPSAIEPLSKAAFWEMKRSRIPDPEIASQSGLRRDQIELFLQQVSHIVNQPTLLHKDQLQPGVRWALGLLHAQGARLVLVTLRCPEQVRQTLDRFQLTGIFSQVYGAQDQNAAYRNYADHKTALLQQAVADHQTTQGRSPHAWMIGDTEADILAGQALGVPTMALTCGIRCQSYLNRFEPSRVHSDLLSAAHYLVYAHRQPQAAAVS